MASFLVLRVTSEVTPRVMLATLQPFRHSPNMAGQKGEKMALQDATEARTGQTRTALPWESRMLSLSLSRWIRLLLLASEKVLCNGR